MINRSPCRLNKSCLHLVVEDLGLASLSLGDERLVQNIENILANTLQLVLDLLAVVTDDGDVLFGALGFLLLLDGGDDTPGSTAGTNDVLVSNGEKVTLIDGKFASNLKRNQSGGTATRKKRRKERIKRRRREVKVKRSREAYVGDFLYRELAIYRVLDK